jgi:hypothetical protein
MIEVLDFYLKLMYNYLESEYTEPVMATLF